MTRNSIPSTPTNPWIGRMHLALTLLLFAAAVSIAGLAVAGRVKFGQPAKHGEPEADPKSKPKAEEGRYQIEKVEDVHEIIDRAGKSFFDTEMYDTWVFKYKGGLIETTLETDLGGETVKVMTLPESWKLALPPQKALAKDAERPVNFTGYIIISTARPGVETLDPYYAHLAAMFAVGPGGPLDVLPALFLEVRQFRPYSIFISASPPPDVPGQGFNIVDRNRPLIISTPLVIKNPALEEAVIGGGKRLQPGKEEIILDRQRGNSRVRLKARFLTDGEARELLPK